MKICKVIEELEEWASPTLQESYDNAGLIIGDFMDEFQGGLITLDVTEDVISEAISKGCNLIIAHHPLIFLGKKRIGSSHWIDKCIRKAIINKINIYAIHTNLDNVSSGVNDMICEKIGLVDREILQPKSSTLQKLTSFIPSEASSTVLKALFDAGAGKIGNYDECSFQSDGLGSFRPNEKANPSIGKKNKREEVHESRIEVLVPSHSAHRIITALKNSHPYEEVAYYLQELKNLNQEIGSGMTGRLPTPMSFEGFLIKLESNMDLKNFKHTKPFKDNIEKIAVCGGSGSFLLKAAIRAKSDVFITSDFKYHEFFEANNQIMIIDIGHYESEVFTKNLIYRRLIKKFASFAIFLSGVNTNPVKYRKY